MRLNLGCGQDLKDGYTNVDARDLGPNVEQRDLSKFPWPWQDGSVEEILMLDFLEHFHYRQTDQILQEAWRILKSGGTLVVQVPDLEHCSRAALHILPFKCNRCGWDFKEERPSLMGPSGYECKNCHQSWFDISRAAVMRLFGGQDYPGNFHYNAFSEFQLRTILVKNGFDLPAKLEVEHQWANWNFKLSTKKVANLWGEE